MNGYGVRLRVLGRDGPIDANRLKIEVYYAKGGVNHWNGRNEPSAIWCGVQPLQFADGAESFWVGSGLRVLVEPASRLNRKRVWEVFKTVVAEVRAKTGHVWAAIQQLLQDKGLVIDDTVQEAS